MKAAQIQPQIQIVQGEVLPIGGPLRGTAHVESARGRWTERRGLLLRLYDEGADQPGPGLGEASPLAGFSHETLPACAAALTRFCQALPAHPVRLDPSGPVRQQLAAALRAIDPALPAARFAVAAALLDLWGRRLCLPAHALLRRGSGPVQLSALIEGLDEATLLRSAHEALSRGLRTLKWKMGRRPFDEELRLLRALRAAIGPDVALRLDAGQSFPRAEVAARLDALAAIAPEYVEEPASPDAWPRAPAVPLALDESLLDPALDVAALLRERTCAALVLKPMALDILRCLDLAELSRAHGARVVVTHLFDGPVGLAAAAELALALDAAPSGLDRHAALPAFDAPQPVRVRVDHISPAGPPGLGLRRETLSIFDAAAEAPDAAALICGDEILTYAALADRARQVLADLTRRGLVPGDGRPVAVVGSCEPRAVVLLLALFAAGVPVVLLHPRLTPTEQAALIADCASHRVSSDVLAILYTSGTTGRPKGALLSRAAFLASARASAANLGWRTDRWLLCLPLAHIGGLSILTRCLLARQAIVLPSGPLDPAALAGLLTEGRITLASLVPTQLARLLSLSPRFVPPAPLRAVLLGGAPASAALLAEARRRGVPVRTTYGLTEACSQVTTQTAADHGDDAGPPLPGVEVRIEPMDENEEGEIQVRGPVLFDGYLGAAAPPFLPGGWFPTGDIGRLDRRGRLFVLARRTDLIVTGGENVYPAEVEQALEAMPGVRAACVFGVPDEIWGQRVAAALVLDGGPADLRGLAALSPHKRPRLLACLPALCYLPGGAKLDRRATAAAAAPHLADPGMLFAKKEC